MATSEVILHVMATEKGMLHVNLYDMQAFVLGSYADLSQGHACV